ncbi:predicted protein [Chaetomium globosum CBS 148.51]|uniref:Uncharacterized protein n=1 Tax=Chaetomium globosum (strain ATCC 6205 / CBS 148.51 / DSM 1962 / NBRC 6347 / NRRL 1970) TaxID=306901 RepID=Q2GS75_CHAGB|nr:uncharacterized protein CHGG_09179 [Chaetomium globosum CBS 148.51]EAQ85165.1 predicted protein [Chaetomium globosum CBS 148.51]
MAPQNRLHGTIANDQHPALGRRPKGRKDLQNLCRRIDCRRIRLLDDTVTETILKFDSGPQGTELGTRSGTIPGFDGGSGIPARELFAIKNADELDGHSVYTLLLHGDELLYVYSDRTTAPRIRRYWNRSYRTGAIPSAAPNPTCCNYPVAAVISQNPYQIIQAGQENNSNPLHGILPKYHPNGTLETILEFHIPDLMRAGASGLAE